MTTTKAKTKYNTKPKPKPKPKATKTKAKALATGTPPVIAYRKAIVTFVDILGFRDIVKRRNAGDIFGAVKKLHASAASDDKEWIEKFDPTGTSNWTRSFAFSDSIVRARPYDAPFSEGGFFHELLALVHAQAQLIESGVLIRGGVTIGDIYFDDTTLFGPALVAAYDLESSHANYPRIVVDPLAINMFRGDPRLRAKHHKLEDEIHYIKRILRRGHDGIWFVDYLWAIHTEFDDLDYFPEFLEKHRKLILEGQADAAGAPRLLHKYLWLATYHNATCDRLADKKLAKKLRIAKADFDWVEEMPEVSPRISD